MFPAVLSANHVFWRFFMKSSSLSVVNSRFKTCVLAACVGAFLLTSPAGAPMARADDFSSVPIGDALYGQLKQVQSASWTAGRGAAHTPNTMTRYEMALEAARAYLSLNARHKADANWQAQPPASVRALREMMLALRPELQRLDVDVTAALELCDALLNRKANSGAAAMTLDGSSIENAATNVLARPAAPRDNNSENTGLGSTALNAGRDFRLSGGDVTMKLSQRLRISAAQSSLERTARDPFGDRRLTGATPENSLSASVGTGATLAVNDWLSLRAGVEERSATPDAFRVGAVLGSQRAPSLIGGAQSQSFGGGLDIEVRPGLRLSGDVARVAVRDFGAPGETTGTRFGGGVDLSAWQNRLALSVNLSRLVPEDSASLASSSAALNLALGGDRLKLKLLYKQLFGEAANAPNNRVIAGGVNINF